jgi:hypothetical protein
MSTRHAWRRAPSKKRQADTTTSGGILTSDSFAEVRRLLKRLALVIAAALTAHSSGPFDQRLSKDQQIVQALNRLTFGPRPGDVEEVRRLGVAKWIELQLHPERIRENPVLDAKLMPLETLTMALPQIVKEYTPQSNSMVMMAPMMRMNTLLSQEEMRKAAIWAGVYSSSRG